MKATRTESLADWADSRAAPPRAAGVVRNRRRGKSMLSILQPVYNEGIRVGIRGIPEPRSRAPSGLIRLNSEAIETAVRFAERHPLRALDALRLALALTAFGYDAPIQFGSEDKSLLVASAAERLPLLQRRSAGLI